jgi:hypothetical protein
MVVRYVVLACADERASTHDFLASDDKAINTMRC